jgi:hypothetical protein
MRKRLLVPLDGSDLAEQAFAARRGSGARL